MVPDFQIISDSYWEIVLILFANHYSFLLSKCNFFNECTQNHGYLSKKKM